MGGIILVVYGTCFVFMFSGLQIGYTLWIVGAVILWVCGTCTNLAVSSFVAQSSFVPLENCIACSDDPRIQKAACNCISLGSPLFCCAFVALVQIMIWTEPGQSGQPGPAAQYVASMHGGEVRNVGVCNWDTWQDVHSVYLANGKMNPVAEPGSSRPLLSKRISVEVAKCRWNDGDKHGRGAGFTACRFPIAPIFGDKDLNAQKVPICAWAVGRPCGGQFADGQAVGSCADWPEPVDCGEPGSGGLCGITRPISDAAKGGGKPLVSDDGAGELEQKLRELAQNNSWEFKAGAPFLELMNPSQVDKGNAPYFWWSIAFCVIYSCPIICLCGLIVKSFARGGVSDPDRDSKLPETLGNRQEHFDQQGFDQRGFDQYNRQGPVGALPPCWEQLTDPQSGRPYFSNRVTGETSWTPPPSALAPPPPLALTPGWEQHTDPQSGRPYFFNRVTGETSWTPPPAPAPPGP